MQEGPQISEDRLNVGRFQNKPAYDWRVAFEFRLEALAVCS